MKLRRTFRDKQGFTLIELLAVVAIIGILFTLVSPQIGKARLKAKLTQEAAKGRYIVEAVTAKEGASRFNAGWPRSKGSLVYASSTEFLVDLVEKGYLDVDYSFFAAPGMTAARTKEEFLEGRSLHNAWCIVLDLQDATPGNFPAVFLKNMIDVNTLAFDENALPFGMKGFAFATKNGEAVAVEKGDIEDIENLKAMFDVDGRADLLVLTP